MAPRFRKWLDGGVQWEATREFFAGASKGALAGAAPTAQRQDFEPDLNRALERGP